MDRPTGIHYAVLKFVEILCLPLESTGGFQFEIGCSANRKGDSVEPQGRHLGGGWGSKDSPRIFDTNFSPCKLYLDQTRNSDTAERTIRYCLIGKANCFLSIFRNCIL